MSRGRRNLKQGSLEGCPEPLPGQILMRVVAMRGSNVIEVLRGLPGPISLRPTTDFLSRRYRIVAEVSSNSAVGIATDAQFESIQRFCSCA